MGTNTLPGLRQAKKLIEPSPQRAKEEFLDLGRGDIRVITGHCPLRYHLQRMGMSILKYRDRNHRAYYIVHMPRAILPKVIISKRVSLFSEDISSLEILENNIFMFLVLNEGRTVAVWYSVIFQKL